MRALIAIFIIQFGAASACTGNVVGHGSDQTATQILAEVYTKETGQETCVVETAEGWEVKVAD
jgi:accessory colonization factor AcfC